MSESHLFNESASSTSTANQNKKTENRKVSQIYLKSYMDIFQRYIKGIFKFYIQIINKQQANITKYNSKHFRRQHNTLSNTARP